MLLLPVSVIKMHVLKMHNLYIFLEEEVATHSSILAWRILRTEEPGGLQSKGSQSDTTKQAGNDFLKMSLKNNS